MKKISFSFSVGASLFLMALTSLAQVGAPGVDSDTVKFMQKYNADSIENYGAQAGAKNPSGPSTLEAGATGSPASASASAIALNSGLPAASLVSGVDRYAVTAYKGPPPNAAKVVADALRLNKPSKSSSGSNTPATEDSEKSE